MEFIGFSSGKPDLFKKSVKSLTEYTHVVIDGEHKYFSEGNESAILFGSVYEWPSDIKDNGNDASKLFSLVKSKNINAATALDGIFVAVVQLQTDIYIIRDYMGVGAQVYYNRNFFSNSMRLMKESGAVQFEPEIPAIADFLQKGYIPAPQTVLKGINKLSPGEYLHFDLKTNEFEIGSSISVTEFTNMAASSNLTFSEAVNKYRELHHKAIVKRISGYKSMGLLLSGGYDSGGNLSALRELYSGEIESYSIGFENSAWSELPLAELMAKKYNARFNPFFLKKEDINDLPQIVHYMGDPFFENGMLLNNKVCSEMSIAPPQVVLGGDGNDQLFGTSGRELALSYLFGRLKLQPLQKLFKYIANRIPSLFRLSFHNENILQGMDSRYFGFSDYELKKLFHSRYNDISGQKVNTVKKVSGPGFDKMFYYRNYTADIMNSAAQVILFKAAQISGMKKVNVVFPYLDADVFKFLQSLPREYKLKGSVKEIAMGKGKSKYLFKEYLKNTLPYEITHRKKQGGFAPMSLFFDDVEFRRKLYVFITRTFSEAGLFDMNEIKRFTQQVEHSTLDVNDWFWHKQTVYAQLSHLLVLAVWWQQFIMDNKKDSLSDYLSD